MITEAQSQKFYKALLDKDAHYEGVFFVGVKTTGVFCRPTCPARKPKFENCEFHRTAQEALLASFRPCMRCRPLSHPNQVSDLVRTLVEAVEADPSRRWKDQDFEALSVDASTARRQFKKRFRMTFVAYARARRMGLAMKKIRCGEAVIDAQLDTGYESSSGFRDAFSKIMGAAPTKVNKQHKILKASWLDTKLGPMLAIADERELYLLEFVERRGLEREIERLRSSLKAAIIPGVTSPITSVTRELESYFGGTLTEFKTPIHLQGSPFQRLVWEELMRIPYGQTRSYGAQAEAIGKATVYRAVANANGANQLAIIIPCHRIINSNGELGGYGGGVTRKQWLINHEKQGLKKETMKTLNINPELARKLIADQFPEYAHLPITSVEKQGHDNRTYRLGNELLIRMPTDESYALKVPKEQALLPQLAAYLSLNIPAPIKMGSPSHDYPYPFSIYKWLDGKSINLIEVEELNSDQLAFDLAKFLKELQSIRDVEGPPPGQHNWWRGDHVSVYDKGAHEQIAELSTVIDGVEALALWERAYKSKWDKAPVWIHGDFAIGNMLIKEGKLSAIIDFGGVALGDPACDLVIAWTFLKDNSREIFIREMALDEDTWLRAKAWVLWKATFELCQLTDKNSPEALIQIKIINEILDD